ncbi:MAG: N-6 DNA methylase [Ktedonobacteraceae bacterium]
MKIAPTYQKLRGGYYTPKRIADFLAQWAIQSPTASVLEPSCGDGTLLEASIETFLRLGSRKTDIAQQLHGIEIDPDEAAKAEERVKACGIYPASGMIHIGDFFTYCKNHLFEQSFMGSVSTEKQTFSAIIGNPPFIRYQNFPEEYRDIAVNIMKQAGFKPSRLMNSWLPFLIASSMLLKPNGRLAMVIPAELFQVNYAAETRRFLSDFYSQITIVTFKKLVFADIQQEVVLLLGERGTTRCNGIRVLEFENADELATHIHREFTEADLKPMDHSKEKWTQYFLNADEIQLLRTLKNNPQLTLSGSLFSVDVGVVTGENKFFILSEQQVKDAYLGDFTKKIVSRSGHLKGTIFSETDWQTNANAQLPAFLLHTPHIPFDGLPAALQTYVLKGEEQHFHKGYKCSIRNPWYIVPSLWRPDAFMLRQVHNYPKIVLNETDATCTDTIHRVRFFENIDKRVVTSVFMNVLTFAFAEVTGRSYGGGVLTFEPSEVEKLLLPLRCSENLDLFDLDKLLRKNDIKTVIEITDQILLKDGLNLDIHEIHMLHTIWEKLRNRRVRRK